MSNFSQLVIGCFLAACGVVLAVTAVFDPHQCPVPAPEVEHCRDPGEMTWGQLGAVDAVYRQLGQANAALNECAAQVRAMQESWESCTGTPVELPKETP